MLCCLVVSFIEFELWNDHQNFVVTFFTCLLIVAALAVVTHQCYIERKLKVMQYILIGR